MAQAKWKNFTKEEFSQFVENSTSYKEVAEKNYGIILFATRAESEENMIGAMGKFIRNMTDLKF